MAEDLAPLPPARTPLFEAPPTPPPPSPAAPAPRGRKISHQEHWRRFHEANPQVYEALLRLARHAKSRRPGAHVGIRLLWERLRWEIFVELAPTAGEPRLNDHHCPFYARLLMDREPDLRGLFETRARRTA